MWSSQRYKGTRGGREIGGKGRTQGEKWGEANGRWEVEAREWKGKSFVGGSLGEVMWGRTGYECIHPNSPPSSEKSRQKITEKKKRKRTCVCAWNGGDRRVGRLAQGFLLQECVCWDLSRDFGGVFY
ncbi:hypothetical protein M8J76_003944 [Diaphorina citri]|nr:hypothetical protein M8J76_010235 [Diaphorina citri]KAI5736502.1 hypothetical protein M8J76_003944 [Diaphorina citri]